MDLFLQYNVSHRVRQAIGATTTASAHKVLTRSKDKELCAGANQPIDMNGMIRLSTQHSSKGQKLMPLQRPSSSNSTRKTRRTKKAPKCKGKSNHKHTTTSSKCSELEKATHGCTAVRRRNPQKRPKNRSSSSNNNNNNKRGDQDAVSYTHLTLPTKA